MELNESEHIVKSELEKLLQKYSMEETMSAVDEIVLNYVLGILESLGSHKDMEDTEDVEQFAEMMKAYLPGFAAISITEVCDWMFSIADKLSKRYGTSTDVDSCQLASYAVGLSQSTDLQCVQENCTETEQQAYTSSIWSISGSSSCTSGHLKRQHSTSDEIAITDATTTCSRNISSGAACSSRNSMSGPDRSSQNILSGADCATSCRENILGASCDTSRGEDSRDVEKESEVLNMLRELCPASVTAELQHCWQLSGGDVEEAARLLLYRQETGTAITVKATPQQHKKSARCPVTQLNNDESIKDTILAKYSFVDTREDKKTHNPSVSLKDEKKLLRYREGQVVSTKGERFSEIKRQDSEEMKKTYVNLKPARKYHFH